MKLRSGLRRVHDGALVLLHDVRDRLSDRRPVVRNPPAGFTRHAVICVNEQHVRDDLRLLIAALQAAGFHCTAVSTNGAALRYRDIADASLLAPSYGRDFTAYRAAYHHLRAGTVPGEGAQILFINDSVWFFRRYLQRLVAAAIEAAGREQLFAGGMNYDQVPHVSGWLFGTPFGAEWRRNLDALFAPRFASRRRTHHIQFGEHRILPVLTRATGVEVFQRNDSLPAVAACYSAVTSGGECFYLKADALLRTDTAQNRFEAFLDLNAEPGERMDVLRWIARRSGGLFYDEGRRKELLGYRLRYFGGRTGLDAR